MRARTAIAALPMRVRRRIERFRRSALLARMSGGRFGLRRLHGTPSTEALPVVMTLWSRPERASAILTELAAQEGSSPIRLLWWNNSRAHAGAYVQAVADADDLGAIASVELRSSRVNIGGLARFLVLRRLRRDGYGGPVVFLDDDQHVGPSFLADLVSRYTPASLRGVWAFRQHGSYWGRDELADGEPATYVGTGGCVLDPAIVDDPEFFAALPDRYRFIEDQWLSFQALRHGWTLAKADIPFEFVLQERNQYHAMVDLKEQFFTYLFNERPDLRPL